MLLIISPEEKYIKNLIDKYEHIKKNDGVLNDIYYAKYKEHEFLIALTGYGKVNITNALRRLCDTNNISVVILIGTAGSISDKNEIFNAVVFNNCLQYDIDFSLNGCKPCVFPNENKGVFFTNEDLRNCLNRACLASGVNYSNDLIASGDMFVCNNNLSNSIRREYNAGAVDVESGVVGQFCDKYNIPFAGVKVISNFAYNNAIKQYNLYEQEAYEILQRITNKFIKGYYE